MSRSVVDVMDLAQEWMEQDGSKSFDALSELAREEPDAALDGIRRIINRLDGEIRRNVDIALLGDSPDEEDVETALCHPNVEPLVAVRSGPVSWIVAESKIAAAVNIGGSVEDVDFFVPHREDAVREKAKQEAPQFGLNDTQAVAIANHLMDDSKATQRKIQRRKMKTQRTEVAVA